MSEPSDLEKHRESLSQRLAALTKQLDHQCAGSQALYEWTQLHQQVLDNLEARFNLYQAEEILFRKLLLANVRFSNSWEEFKDKCLKFEEELGYFKVK